MGEGKRATPSQVPKPETCDLLHYHIYRILQSKTDSGSARTCEFSVNSLWSVLAGKATGSSGLGDSEMLLIKNIWKRRNV